MLVCVCEYREEIMCSRTIIATIYGSNLKSYINGLQMNNQGRTSEYDHTESSER